MSSQPKNLLTPEEYLALDRKNDRTWTYSEFHDIEDVVPLHAIDCNLVLKDVYAKVV